MIRDMSRGAATHSQRLEKWLGKDEPERLSAQFRKFYYPVPVHGVPGRVYVMPGGDFAGPVEAGQEMSALDRADAALTKHRREITRYRFACMRPRQRGAFANLAAVLAAQAGGKSCYIGFNKTNSVQANAAGGSTDLWIDGGSPPAGGFGAAAPGGTVPTSATTGAMPFVNAVSNANTSRFMSGWVSTGISSSPAGPPTNSLLLCDRLFMVAKTMNSTATEAVTGVPTRYTSQTPTAGDYIGGNFCYPYSTLFLPATAHNWTVCQYTNQAGTTGQSFPLASGVASNATGAIDLVVNSWFMPLAPGDCGVKALTQMQASAAVATGTIDFVVSHPIAWMGMPVCNLVCQTDNLNTAFNLVTIYDNACLYFMALCYGNAAFTAPYSGRILIVSE